MQVPRTDPVEAALSHYSRDSFTREELAMALATLGANSPGETEVQDLPLNVYSSHCLVPSQASSFWCAYDPYCFKLSLWEEKYPCKHGVLVFLSAGPAVLQSFQGVEVHGV